MQDIAHFFQLLSERISANNGKIPDELLHALIGSPAHQADQLPQAPVPEKKKKKGADSINVKNPHHKKIIMSKFFGIKQ